MDFDGAGFTSPYRDRKLHPEDVATLDKLTTSRSWDSVTFRQVLISIGTLGKGVSIPAYNRPNSVHTKGWTPVVEDIIKRSVATGREVGRSLFVDTRAQKLLFSPTVSIGTESEVVVSGSPPDFQRPQDFVGIGLVHSHPINARSFASGHGLSPADYYALLGSSSLQLSMITFGDIGRLLIMKTSATPNGISIDDVKRRMGFIEQEFLDLEKVKSVAQAMTTVVGFNKQVCMEFGLTMYSARKPDFEQFHRVEVTK